jgi:hypothetical protein
MSANDLRHGRNGIEHPRYVFFTGAWFHLRIISVRNASNIWNCVCRAAGDVDLEKLRFVSFFISIGSAVWNRKADIMIV